MGRYIKKRVDTYPAWSGLDRRNASIRDRHGTILGTEGLPEADPLAPVKRERLASDLIAKTHELRRDAFREAIDGSRSPAFHRTRLARLVHGNPAP